MKAKGLEFCVRLKGDWWNVVNQFTKEPEMEKIVSLNLPKKDQKKTRENLANTLIMPLSALISPINPKRHCIINNK
jgi:hypothetical protein